MKYTISHGLASLNVEASSPNEAVEQNFRRLQNILDLCADNDDHRTGPMDVTVTDESGKEKTLAI